MPTFPAPLSTELAELLWEELARRYRGNPAVAGYNVMNEPVTGVPRGRFVNRYTRWAAASVVP